MKRINKTVLIVILIVTLMIRFAGDTLFFIIDSLGSPASIVWKVFTTLIILIPVYFLFFNDKQIKYTEYSDKSDELYFNKIFRLSIISSGLFIIYLFLNYYGIQKLIEFNLIDLIICELFAVYTLISGLFILQFLYEWLSIRRHKKTTLYLIILRNVLFYFVIVEFLTTTFKSLDKPVVSVLSLLMLIFTAYVILVLAKKNQWIAILPRSQKYKLLWFSLFAMIITLSVSNIAFLSGTAMNISLIFLMPGSASFIAVTFGIATLYFLRIFLSTVASLPTSYIVERQTRELSSLTELNKIVAETIDLDELLNTVARLALNSTRGLAAWIELYSNDGKITISAVQNISEGQINTIDKTSVLENIFKSIEKPLLIDSIFENKEIASLNWSVIPSARALLAVPLHSGGNKIGTLCVLCTDEYGFESDDVKILKAFSDNVSIAIENARLLKDSIEKERYKRELMLAREMEEKLLPQVLPDILNYSVSAFSIPADEVGGDYYDIVYLKNGKPCLLIADVSGKGISAAFYMAQLKGVVLALARESTGAADILKKINYTLYKSIEKQMYITIAALVIEDSDGNITFARAGHMPVIFKDGNGVREYIPKGIGVGLADNSIFDAHIEEVSLKLLPDDIVLLFTDGVNEMKNSRNEEFGVESLKSMLYEKQYHNLIDFSFEIKNMISQFLGNEHQRDDMTVVTLSFNGGNF